MNITFLTYFKMIWRLLIRTSNLLTSTRTMSMFHPNQVTVYCYECVGSKTCTKTLFPPSNPAYTNTSYIFNSGKDTYIYLPGETRYKLNSPGR